MTAAALRPALLLLAMIAGIAGCRREASPDVSPPPASAATPVRLQLDWYPQAEHGGFYQALAKGFYAAEGLHVTLLPGGPGPGTSQKLIAGVGDVAIHRSDDLLAQISQGLPFVMVAAFMQHDPQALLLHADNPIDDFAELDGQTVMAKPGTGWLLYLEARYRIKLRVVPMNYSLAQFLADPAFIQQCFITSEPFHARQQGARPKTLLLAGSGYDPYRVIYTTERFARQQPEVLRAFVRASLRGWQDFINGDPTPGKALILSSNDQMSEPLLDYSITTMRTHRLVDGNPARDEQAGLLTRERLEEQIRLLLELGIIDRSLSVDQVASFQFLPDHLRAPGGD